MTGVKGRADVLVPVHKGTIAELLVANALIVQSAGQVKVFRPWPDDHGADFRLAHRGDPRSLELQVKSDFAPARGNAFHFIIEIADLPTSRSAYRVLACAVDEAAGHLRDALWLIPGDAFPRGGSRGATFSWSPPVGNRRPSKWDRYRLDLRQLGPAVEQTLQGPGRRPRRPAGAVRELAPATKGFVIENAVIVAAALGSDGRVCAFRPAADVVGLDLAFQSLDGRVQVAAQVKGDFVQADREAVDSFIDARTFRAREDRLLIVAPYLPAELRLAKTSWLMTTAEFAARAKRRPGGLEFYGSPREGAKDTFAEFRIPAARLGEAIERCIAVRVRSGPSARLPTGAAAARDGARRARRKGR